MHNLSLISHRCTMYCKCVYGQQYGYYCSHSHQLLLSIFKAIGQEVDWLHLCDGVLLKRGFEWIEGTHIRLVRQAVLCVCVCVCVCVWGGGVSICNKNMELALFRIYRGLGLTQGIYTTYMSTSKLWKLPAL